MGINTVTKKTNVYTYAGMKLMKQVGHQTLFKLDAWFESHNIYNILSLDIMTKHYPVEFYLMGNLFEVHLQDQEIVFSKYESVMYYFDTAVVDFDGEILTSIVYITPVETSVLNTVAENCS